MRPIISGVCAFAMIFTPAPFTMPSQTPSSGQTPTPAQTPSEKAWTILQSGMGEKSIEKRSEAVRALGLITNDPKALDFARTSLKDIQHIVRSAAATAMGQIGSPAAIPDLKSALSDKDAGVVLAAAHALHLLQDPSAYEVYYAVLTGERKSNQGILGEGRDTLKDKRKMAEFGVEEGLGFIPFAGFGYSAVKALRKDDVSPVRAGAAAILASDPDPRSASALVKAVSDKSWIVRAAALDALAKRGNPKLMDAVVPAMSDQKDVVRYTAAAAVIKLSAVANAVRRPKPTRPAPKKKG